MALLAATLCADGARAQTGCVNDDGSVTITCSSSLNISRQFLQQRADRTLAAAPETGQIAGRFSGSAWDPGANGAAPVSVAPGDDAATLKTSLSQWGSFIARSDAQKIEEAKKLAPKGLKLPAPAVVQQRSVDVWTETRFNYADGRDAASRGYTSYLGADYAIGRNVLFGAMAQLEDLHQSTADWGPSGAAGEAYLAGPYVAMRLTPNLTLDAKAAWGQGSVDAGAGNLASDRSLAEARLKGNWSVNDWRLSPSASVSRVTESAANVPGTAVEVERLSVGPEIARPVPLGDGRVVEPFLHYKNSLDLDAASALLQSGSPVADLNAQGTVGGGLTYSKPNEYTIRATADVQGVGSEADKNLSSRVQVSIPLD